MSPATNTGVSTIAQAQTDQNTTTTTTEGTSDGDLWWRVRDHCAGASLESAAKFLGMSTAELEDALAAGSSIAEVAAGKGVAEQAVIDAMVADATARLDEAVADGDLSADRGEETKASCWNGSPRSSTMRRRLSGPGTGAQGGIDGRLRDNN